MIARIKTYLVNFNFILGVYILVTVLASLAKYLHVRDQFTNYNNYVIFRNSFLHLISNKDIYAWYLDEQWDLYKYSPSFAAFMGLAGWETRAAGVQPERHPNAE